MTTLEINGRRVQVSDDFRNLSPAEQENIVQGIAAQMGLQEQPEPASNNAMGFVNRGIARSVGGVVDFLNPFDNEAWRGTPLEMGSARTGLTNAMNAMGNAVGGRDIVADRAPETAGEAFFQGAGEAAGALPVVGATLNAARTAGGMVGNLADDATRALATRTGLASEPIAGGVSEAARFASEQRGDPQLVQDILAIAAPVGVLGAGQAALGVATKGPTGQLARAGYRNVAATVLPYTRAGGREVARKRVQDLAGGPERADQLSQQITDDNPLGLTPAQQTGDENLMGLENLAADQNPVLREQLDAMEQTARDRATDEIRQGAGDVDDTREVFRNQRAQFKERLETLVQDRIARADAQVDAMGPQRSEMQNSMAAQEAVREALEDALAAERQLWDRIPRYVSVVPSASTMKAKELIGDTVWAQERDIPRVARELLERTGSGETQTVAEMHGLYSELRRVARSAMAGNDQNKNMARIANEVADAILEDFSALPPAASKPRFDTTSEAFVRVEGEGWRFIDRSSGEAVGATQQRSVAQKINRERFMAVPESVYMPALNAAIRRGGPDARPTVQEIEDGIAYVAGRRGIAPEMEQTGGIGEMLETARNFSRELHETFDRGAVGKILQRTLDGDTTIEPELALGRTVARGGILGEVAARQITEAAPQAEPMAEDVVRGMFERAVRTETGEFNSRAAARFRRDNADLLNRFPALRDDIKQAVADRDDAAAFAKRVEDRLSNLDATRKSAVARFLDGPPERAIKAVIQDPNPIRAAAKLSAAARRDPSGEAMAGLKDAFSSQLIGGEISGTDLLARMNDKRFGAALRRVYSNAEMGRMRRIAADLAKVEARSQGANVGTDLTGASPNRWIDYLVRMVAMENAPGASGVTRLQTSAMVSRNTGDVLGRLTRNKAEKMLMDAVTDPALMRALLADPGTTTFKRKAEGLLLPYLVGAGAATATE